MKREFASSLQHIEHPAKHFSLFQVPNNVGQTNFNLKNFEYWRNTFPFSCHNPQWKKSCIPTTAPLPCPPPHHASSTFSLPCVPSSAQSCGSLNAAWTTFHVVSILSVPLLSWVGLATLLLPVVVVVHGAAWLVSLQSLCASSSPRVCRTPVYI